MYNYRFILDNMKLDNFDNFLNKWPSKWVQFKREIRLNTLLCDKRVQFEIDDINEYGKIDGMNHMDMMLSDIVFIVKKITMIIRDDLVEELEIEWKPLETYIGKSIIELLNNKFVEISMKFKNDQFLFFYIKNPSEI